MGDELWDRFTGGKEGTLWYYRALVEAYAKAGSSPVIEELERVVREIEAFAGRDKAAKPPPAQALMRARMIHEGESA